jgi:hypothetical protein
MHFVRNAKYDSGYRLILTFEDDSKRMVDLKDELHGEVFLPLGDVNYFKTVKVDPDLDTIVWDNGADFSPDFLYEIGQELSGRAPLAK